MKLPIQMSAIALLSATAATCLAQASFTRVTTGPLVTTAGKFSSCAWADYDNDGLIDLFVGGGGGGGLPPYNDSHNFLFHNEGNGVFRAVTTGAIVTDVSQSYGNTWGDYDNDGFLDLFVGNSYAHGDKSFLYHNNGDGTFTRITTGPVVETFGRCSGCSWSDYDRDGFLDLYVCNSGQPNLLYHNRQDGTFAAIATGSLVNAVGDSLVPTWSDYNNDGWPDLFVARGYGVDPHGQLSLLYRNNGDGNFTQTPSSAFFADAENSVSAAWGDYDNDGYPDLVFVNNNSQKNSLYHNNGNGNFTKVTTGPVANDSGNWLGCAWGDYDNDGFLDLFVGSHYEGRNALYHNNGDGTFTRILEGPIVEVEGQTGGCAWGDYDNDGFLDLFITNWAPEDATSGHNLLYHNTGNGNAWIEVRCVGTASNRSAIGAKVRVQATVSGKELRQLREITPGDGFNGNSMVAHFGLGDATAVESLTIEWPSGVLQTMTNVPARLILTVLEPPQLRLKNSPTNGALQLQLIGGAGNFYELQTSTDLRQWTRWLQITSTNRSMTLLDTNAATGQQRFYRGLRP